MNELETEYVMVKVAEGWEGRRSGVLA